MNRRDPSRRLHLVRHATVIVDRERPAADWQLAPHGSADVVGLLNRFEPSNLRRVIASREMKARQTGQVLAETLDLPLEVRSGLEEHHRCSNDFFDAAAFRRVVTAFFARPEELVFGKESADAAFRRFDRAVRGIMGETRDDELIVAHGRVISLFLAQLLRSDPMAIWSSLKLPDHHDVAWPEIEPDDDGLAGVHRRA